MHKKYIKFEHRMGKQTDVFSVCSNAFRRIQINAAMRRYMYVERKWEALMRARRYDVRFWIVDPHLHFSMPVVVVDICCILYCLDSVMNDKIYSKNLLLSKE